MVYIGNDESFYKCKFEKKKIRKFLVFKKRFKF